MPSETKTQLLYEMLEKAVIHGIGNCTQVCNHVSQYLNDGVMPIAGWRNSLPGFKTTYEQEYSVFDLHRTHKKIMPKMRSETRKLLEILQRLLQEGQHVQINAKMKGRAYETVRIRHLFNAIKVDGQIKIIDCYQGVSSEPWLKQAWYSPNEFLSHFENFYFSKPMDSRLDDMMIDYLEASAKKSQAESHVSAQSGLISSLTGYLGFFRKSKLTSDVEAKTDLSEDLSVPAPKGSK